MAVPFNRLEYRPESRRVRIDPSIFEMRSELANYDRHIRLGWRSYRLELQQTIEISEHWCMEVSRVSGLRAQEELFNFMEEVIGGTINRFVRNCRDPRPMVEALMPHFEREIVLQMERIEREYRYNRPNYLWIDEAAAIAPDDWRAITPNRIWYGIDQAEQNPEAKKKARALLIKNLDERQRQDFETHKQFTLTGKDGKLYVITSARSFNVQGPDGTKYCGQLQDTPIEDQMLAQKLLLEHEPEKFFKNANKMGGPSACLTYEDAWRSMTNQNINALNRLMRERLEQIQFGALRGDWGGQSRG